MLSAWAHAFAAWLCVWAHAFAAHMPVLGRLPVQVMNFRSMYIMADLGNEHDMGRVNEQVRYLAWPNALPGMAQCVTWHGPMRYLAWPSALPGMAQCVTWHGPMRYLAWPNALPGMAQIRMPMHGCPLSVGMGGTACSFVSRDGRCNMFVESAT